jgi:hypothetical protein
MGNTLTEKCGCWDVAFWQSSRIVCVCVCVYSADFMISDYIVSYHLSIYIHNTCHVRRFFVSPGDPFISSYDFRSRVLVCMDLVTHHKKRYTCAHYTPVFRENFLLTPLFINPLLGVDDWNVPCGQSLSCVYFLGDSWPYLLVRLVLTHPMTSLAPPSFDAIWSRVWMPRGTFRVVTCHRNLCLIA